LSLQLHLALLRRPVFGALLPLNELDHDAFRPAHESEAQPGIAGKRANSDLGAFGAQLLHCGINVVDRQPNVLEPVMRKRRRRHIGLMRCGGAITFWPPSRIVMRCCPG